MKLLLIVGIQGFILLKAVFLCYKLNWILEHGLHSLICVAVMTQFYGILYPITRSSMGTVCH